MHRYCLLLVLASGCVFHVAGIDSGGSSTDDGGGMAGEDLAGNVIPGGGEDLATPPGPVDMATTPPDLQPLPLGLSHVPQHYLTDGTCELTVNTSIDTTARTVDGASVPAGCMFVTDSEAGGLNVAVLVVHSLTVPAGTVSVTGNVPLVVVAGTTINVAGVLDGSAKKATAGPGGGAPTVGAGKGPDGVHADPYSDAGGNGGSYGTAGNQGGVGTYNGTVVNPQAASSPYATAALATSVPAGSGGGTGASENCNSKKGGNGGAGGGSIQLSAGSSITVAGMINVGGGAGAGGCRASTVDQGSGGGGGSGGAIFLESPVVTVNGGLWANGASGGGGASGPDTAGSDGNNATTTQTGATGGPNGGTYGGTGGAGGAKNTAAGKGLDSANGGGGGGGVGRIVVRSRGSATVPATNASPAPFLDPAVP